MKGGAKEMPSQTSDAQSGASGFGVSVQLCSYFDVVFLYPIPPCWNRNFYVGPLDIGTVYLSFDFIRAQN